MNTNTEIVKRSYDFSNDELQILSLSLGAELGRLEKLIQSYKELDETEKLRSLVIKHRNTEKLYLEIAGKTDFRFASYL
ncbi:hypothetical protein ACE40W_22755 [Enterococcus avium]|uniref:hypothetical protein n=1 Tax=Enterococcus avium TaxID=33945 RepID=UPI0035CB99BF